MIYHIALASEWQSARRDGVYARSTRGRSLEQEGFIHCSTRAQVEPVLARFYSDCREALVLLTVDDARLRAPLRYEAVGGEAYPHLYGALETSAVVAVTEITRAADGAWVIAG